MMARTVALALLLCAFAAPGAWAQPESAAAPRHAAARAVLKDVLAQPAFVRASRQSWQKRLQDRIREWLQQIASRVLSPVAGRRSITALLAWAVSIAAIVVLGVWLVRVAFQRRADSHIGLEGARAVEVSGHVLGAEAAALLRAGRIRDGARAAYRAAIRRLEEEGALATDPARTPREYVRLLRPSHRGAAALASLTAAFEAMWYGSRPAGAEDAARLMDLLRELECLPTEAAK